jgi:hypothetical protein
MGITKAAMAANRNRRRWINCLPFDLFGPLPLLSPRTPIPLSGTGRQHPAARLQRN